MQNFITAKTVRRLAAKLFPGNDPQSFIQRQRPRICPFEKLLCLIPPNASLLDLGCGSGLFLGLAAELDLISSALGIDRRQRVIATANEMKRRINSGRGDRLVFQNGDATEISERHFFDVVTIVDLVHHIPRRDRSEVVRQAYERLSPGGTLMYKDIGRTPLWRAGANFLHDLILSGDLVSYSSPQEVQCWVGHPPLYDEKLFRLCYAHELLVFRKPG